MMVKREFPLASLSLKLAKFELFAATVFIAFYMDVPFFLGARSYRYDDTTGIDCYLTGCAKLAHLWAALLFVLGKRGKGRLVALIIKGAYAAACFTIFGLCGAAGMWLIGLPIVASLQTLHAVVIAAAWAKERRSSVALKVFHSEEDDLDKALDLAGVTLIKQ